MGSEPFESILDQLGDQFGRLDNTVERWVGHHSALTDMIPQIEQAIKSSFGEESAPAKIFKQGSDTYLNLLADLEGNPGPETPPAYLNLRFFILLNAFVQACHESLEKSALNPGLDPADLVERSDYRPYFFERASASRSEMVQMLEEELSQLGTAPRDRRGVLRAMRSRNGVYATLAELYCPTHPRLYPLVQELDAIRSSSDPGVIDLVESKLGEILDAI